MTITKNERGQALMATVVVVSVVALILIGALVFQNMSIQRQTTRSVKSAVAYQLARAAVEKGMNVLDSSVQNWNTVNGGGTLPGFNGDVVYTDLPGGAYKVVLQAGPTASDCTVIGYARDNAANAEYRALQVVLSKSGRQFAPLMGYDVLLQKRTKVQWGPIYAYNSLDIKPKSRVFYPRLFSMGKIKHIDNNPALPNTDGVRWWSFNFSPGVPAWPQLDFAYYKALAQQQGLYYAKRDRKNKIHHGDDDDHEFDSCDEGHRDDQRENHCDEDDDDSWTYQNIIDTQPYVRFYDTGVKVRFKGGHNLLRGVIIAMDSIEFKDRPASIAEVNQKYSASGLSSYYPRQVQVPPNAWLEYQKIDTPLANDYPGDLGGPGPSGVSRTYNFGAATNDNLDTTAPIHVEGLLYAAKQIKFHRGGTVVGIVMSASKDVKLENSDEDEDDGNDDSRDCDRFSSDADSDHPDRDYHNEDGAKWNQRADHVDHDSCHDDDDDAHRRRLNIYFQNLTPHVLASGAKETLFQEVAPQKF